MKKLTAAIKAMADEPRLSILIVLALRGAVCVSHLQEAMKTPQPTVSRYLAILRNAGLLEAERKGQWVYYRLNEEEEGTALEIIKKYAEKLKETSKIKKIMDRLDKIEQQPSLTGEIEGADRKKQMKGNRAQKHSKRAVFEEKRPETESDMIPESEESVQITEGLQGTAIKFEDSSSSVPEARPETRIEETEGRAVSEDVEAVSADTAAKEKPIEKKKGKREKKPQPPSLFDF